MIKYIVFDFGDTIIRFDGFEISKKFIKEDENFSSFVNTVFDRKYWDKLDFGIIDNDYWCGECSKLVMDYQREGLKNLCKSWYIDLPVISGMDTLIKELHNKGYKLYLLSNISNEFAKNSDKVPLLSYFDGLVMSGAIKMGKPNRDIYDYLFEKYSLSPSEGIFVDNNSDNIKAGEDLGLRGYLFDGSCEKLRNYLKDYIEL